jgi:hypothetical protein
MTVLPNCFYYHQGRLRWNLAKYLHAASLTIDESVALDRVAPVAAANIAAFAPDSVHHRFLRARLRRPALLIRGQAQISIRN